MRSAQSSAASTSVTRSAPDGRRHHRRHVGPLRRGVLHRTAARRGRSCGVGHRARSPQASPRVHPDARGGRASRDLRALHRQPARVQRPSLWHSDVTWAERPPKYSILHMQVSPAVGGDTMWSSQHVAFETLSAPMQAFLESLTAHHQHPIDAEHRGRSSARVPAPGDRAQGAVLQPDVHARRSTSWSRTRATRSWRCSTRTRHDPSSAAGGGGRTATSPSGTTISSSTTPWATSARARRKIHRIEIEGAPPVPASLRSTGA